MYRYIFRKCTIPVLLTAHDNFYFFSLAPLNVWHLNTSLSVHSTSCQPVRGIEPVETKPGLDHPVMVKHLLPQPATEPGEYHGTAEGSGGGGGQ